MNDIDMEHLEQFEKTHRDGIDALRAMKFDLDEIISTHKRHDAKALVRWQKAWQESRQVNNENLEESLSDTCDSNGVATRWSRKKYKEEEISFIDEVVGGNLSKDLLTDFYKVKGEEILKAMIVGEEDEETLDFAHTLINTFETSYLAPAYHFNAYVDAIIYDNMKNSSCLPPDEDGLSNAGRRLAFQIQAQTTLYSLKSALDRFVGILSNWYSGIATSSTFGRVSETSKPRGLVGFALSKQGDPIMDFIVKEYKLWIKDAVEPRDVITHYNDLVTSFTFDPHFGLEFPIHHVVKLSPPKKRNPEGENQNSIDAQSERAARAITAAYLRESVVRWYDFADHILDALFVMPPRRRRKKSE